jgi:hypothetical protein
VIANEIITKVYETMIARVAAVFDQHFLVMTVTPKDGEYSAQIAQVVRATQKVTTPILVGDFRGATPGAAVDRALEAARTAFDLD